MTDLTSESWDALSESLVRARDRGFLGPGPVDEHIQRALGFAECLTPPSSLADIGTGAGLPGLVLAFCWPQCQLSLIDASERRIDALQDELQILGLADRVTAICGRMEDLARTSLRANFPLVVSRGFGRPAVTAECAAPLLTPEGLLAVAEPPEGSEDRWPGDRLAELGLGTRGLHRGSATIQVLQLTGETPLRYPRKNGMPAKRPLWT